MERDEQDSQAVISRLADAFAGQSIDASFAFVVWHPKSAFSEVWRLADEKMYECKRTKCASIGCLVGDRHLARSHPRASNDGSKDNATQRRDLRTRLTGRFHAHAAVPKTIEFLDIPVCNPRRTELGPDLADGLSLFPMTLLRRSPPRHPHRRVEWHGRRQIVRKSSVFLDQQAI